MNKVLQALAGLSLAAVIVLTLNSAPESRFEAVDEALTSAQLNEDRAESAPQQQVVNGWAARDLRSIQARQLDDIVAAQRMQTVILVLVGLTGVLLVASLTPRRETAAGGVMSSESESGNDAPPDVN